MILHRAYVLVMVATVVFSALLLSKNMGSLRCVRVMSSPVFATFWPNILESTDVKDAAASSHVTENQRLKVVLKTAANENNTVIITILNEAWAGPDLLFDLFIKSFRVGENTKVLLNHLVVVTLDQQAFVKCKQVHKYCYVLFTQEYDFHREAYFMTPSYIKLVWTRLDFLRTVLEMGYNFVFTDTDILWFRNPFPLFDDADIQVSCDQFIGRPYDLRNLPNVGFNYVRSNKQSIEFFKFWYESGKEHPTSKLQDVLNIVMFDTSILSVGVKIKFFDTAFFGGLCSPMDIDLSMVYTMHANCCVGLDNKLQILKFLLERWQQISSLPVDQRNVSKGLEVPSYCRLSLPNQTYPTVLFPETRLQVQQPLVDI